MSQAIQQQVISDYLKATADRDFERMASMLTEDFTLWMVPSARDHGMPIPLSGRSAFLDFVRGLQSRPSKWRIHTSTPLRFFFNGDDVAVWLRNVGEFPSGYPYDNEYVFLYRFEGDKLAEMREFTDTRYIASLTEKAMA